MLELHTTGRDGSINRVLESHFPTITARAAREIPEAVERALYGIEKGAKERARVDTSFMRGEIEAVYNPGSHEGEVIAGANYTAVHEYGSVYGPLRKGRGRITAQPMFGPAAEEERPLFLADVHAAYRVR